MTITYKVVTVEPATGEIVESEAMSYADACALQAKLMAEQPDYHHEVVATH